MRELALFAGAGGGLLASRLLGWRTVGAVEIEEYPRDRLIQRQNEGYLDQFPIWDDVRTFDGKPWRGYVDIITGGFPCQDISAAGKGAGLTGSRSGLWFEYQRIIEEVRPGLIFAENSPLLRTRGLDIIIKNLTKMGYDVRWCVLGSGHIGFPHLRKRLWLVAHTKCTRTCMSTETGITFRSQQIPQRLAEGSTWWSDSDVENADDPTPQPLLGGMDDAVADWLDRIKAVGNGQVPAVAATAFRILSADLNLDQFKQE